MDKPDGRRPALPDPAQTLLLSLALAAAFAILFRMLPVVVISDSNYTLMLSEHLLYRQTFQLDEHFTEPLDPATYLQSQDGKLPYMVRKEGGHVYFWLPPGSSVLSMPFVAVFNAAGTRAIAADGTYNAQGEWRMQRHISAILCGLFVGLCFLFARLYLSAPWSFAVAACAGLASPVLSTCSRGLWSHTWGILLVLAAIGLMQLEADRRRTWIFVAAGTLLSWGYFVRPTFLLASVGLAGLAWSRHRARAWPLLATLAAWHLLFVAYAESLYGQVLPGYYTAGRVGHFEHFGAALMGNFISPSRGLFVFVPGLCLVMYFVLRYRVHLPDRALACVAAGCLGAHALMVSTFPKWWGGHSFGPRLMADTLPWLVVLGVLGLAARKAAHSPARERAQPLFRQRVAWCAGVLLWLASAAIHLHAACSDAPMRWNYTPDNVDDHPERVWRWNDPQALRIQ